MGKHSKEKEKTKIKLKSLIITILFILVITTIGVGTYFGYKNIDNIKNFIEENSKSISKIIKGDTTIENEILVMKSLTDYNKIIEYKFDNNKLASVIIYEQFKNNEEFEEKMQSYELQKNINIVEVKKNKKSILIEKKDFGSDANLNYSQIYDKYLVQIIGAYEQI